MNLIESYDMFTEPIPVDGFRLSADLVEKEIDEEALSRWGLSLRIDPDAGARSESNDSTSTPDANDMSGEGVDNLIDDLSSYSESEDTNSESSADDFDLEGAETDEDASVAVGEPTGSDLASDDLDDLEDDDWDGSLDDLEFDEDDSEDTPPRVSPIESSESPGGSDSDHGDGDIDDLIGDADLVNDLDDLVDEREVEFLTEEERRVEEVRGITDRITQQVVADLQVPRLEIDAEAEIPLSVANLVQGASVESFRKKENTDYFTFYLRQKGGKYLDIGEFPQKFVALMGQDIPSRALRVVTAEGEIVEGNDLDTSVYEPIFPV